MNINIPAGINNIYIFQNYDIIKIKRRKIGMIYDDVKTLAFDRARSPYGNGSLFD